VGSTSHKLYQTGKLRVKTLAELQPELCNENHNHKSRLLRRPHKVKNKKEREIFIPKDVQIATYKHKKYEKYDSSKSSKTQIKRYQNG
jgi:hypothetical protein